MSTWHPISERPFMVWRDEQSRWESEHLLVHCASVPDSLALAIAVIAAPLDAMPRESAWEWVTVAKSAKIRVMPHEPTHWMHVPSLPIPHRSPTNTPMTAGKVDASGAPRLDQMDDVTDELKASHCFSRRLLVENARLRTELSAVEQWRDNLAAQVLFLANT